MSDTSKLSRRNFLEKTAAVGTAGVAAPYFVPAGALGLADKPAANDRLGIALIGCGGMGSANLKNCAEYDDVAVTGICDVWKERRDALVEKYKPSAKPYHDYREMLGQDDVDGVIVAAPGHWHALQTIHACEAGKDVYVQKPMTLHLAESLAVKRAAEKHKTITQVGTQVHSRDNYRRVVEQVRSGNLGKISVVRTFVCYNQGPEGIGTEPDGDPPEGLDWDLWQGPARARRCNPLAIAGAYPHASFMDYGGGMTPGMAPHIVDLPYWALDLDYPTCTSSSGGRFVIQDSGDAPDSHEILWQFPNMTMTWMMSLVSSYSFDLRGKSALGIYFHGVNGTLYANYGLYEIVPEGDRMKDAKAPEESIPPSPGQEREWLDSIKSRQQPSCNVFYHNKLNAAICLGTLAWKLGRSVRFDPATERVVGDDEAARLAVPEYRRPWVFPKEYLEA
ncbi:MAG TPA: Gfo/Idh/MocA family oxidoreductase [Thermoguttaceae bacterium]|nr:Gfo/Idh/MocA family oxidoreductase [Thermoguttaceae bacterium]